MAVNDCLYRRGTPFTLSSGDCSGLMPLACGSGSGVQSNKFDFGDPHADEYEMFVELTTVDAPTVFKSYDFYIASSLDNTNFAGNAAGTSGQYMTPATIQNFLPQLDWAGSLSVFASGGTTQRQACIVRPVTQYASLIMYNNTDTASSITGSKVTFTPLIPQTQIT
jgi:hypothetical protein